MSRILLASGLLACVGPSSIADSTPTNAKEVKILAHGDWPHVPVYSPVAPPRELKQWVFRGEKELAAVAGPHAARTVAAALKVDAIDFEKQMLLAVFDGTQPLVGVSGGGPPSAPNRIEVRRIERSDDGKTLTVRWRTVPRDPKGDVLTAPLQAVLVERFDGDVRFERDPAAGKDREPPAEGKEVAVLARADWPDGWQAEEPARRWVVRRYEDLVDPRIEAPDNVIERMRQEASDRYAKALKVDKIDWDKQMVVGVSGGVRPSGGYTVEVTKAETDADGKRLTVHWAVRPPEKGAKVSPEPTHPAAVVLADQFAGEVDFQEDNSPNP